MSVNVSSIVLTTIGRDFVPNVQEDPKQSIQRLRADSVFEWSPELPEQLDVKSLKCLTPISPTKLRLVPATCQLTRSKVVWHGHRLSQSSQTSETVQATKDGTADAGNTDVDQRRQRSPSASGSGRLLVGLPKSPVEASPSSRSVGKANSPNKRFSAQRPLTGESNYALQLLPSQTHNQPRCGEASRRTTPAPYASETTSWLQPPSPTLSQASFATAREQVSDDNHITPTVLNHVVDVAYTISEDKETQRVPREESKSTSKASKQTDTGKDTLFARFKTAIRAKAKARRANEWWEYENPTSLNRICRAQNALIPEGTQVKLAKSPHSPTSVPNRSAGLGQNAASCKRLAPQSPVSSERVLLAPQIQNSSEPEAPPSKESTEELERWVAALQQNVDSLPKQADTASPTSVAASGRISVAYIECDVCGDSLPSSFFVKRITAICSHKNNTCRDCLSQWISTCLESRGWDSINCPGCPELLDAFDVKRSADAKVFQRYDELATRAYLSTLPDFRWCAASSCGSGQLHPESTGPIFTCAACGHKYCVKHNIWHGGETCKEYEYRTGLDGGKKEKEEKASEAKLQKISKQCPGRKCGWRIEKNNGCDHMTCRKCRYEFCWQCLADYGEIRRKGNSAHKKSCKYHSNNIR